MKRMFCILLALAALCLCFPVHAETTRYGTMMVDNCKEWVSLREGPGTSRKRLAKVPLFALVTDAEWEPGYGDFIRCSYDGKTGYILSKYLVPWNDPEPAEEARYTGAQGFSFYYDPSAMEVDDSSSEDGHGLIINADTENSAVYLEFLTYETTGMTAAEFLAKNAPDGTVYQTSGTEYGLELTWFQKSYAPNAELTETYYALDDGGNGLAAVGVWPSDGNGYWLDLFTDLMRSVHFEKSLPVRAEWAKAGQKALVVDRDGQYVSVTFLEEVTGVTLLSLDLSFSGDAFYEATELRKFGKAGPDSPLVLKIAFPGDIPCYGIRFTDGKGTVRQFALSVSGRDGALELEEF